MSNGGYQHDTTGQIDGQQGRVVLPVLRPYRVFLVNALKAAGASASSLPDASLAAMATKLKQLFDAVVKAHDALATKKMTFGSSSVQWITAAPQPAIQTYELLIFLMAFGMSICQTGEVHGGSPPAGHDGLTNPNLTGGTGSEVYLHFSDPILLANLAFHESMHNKLALGNPGLHPLGGLANGTPNGTPPGWVEATTPLTPDNTSRMANALETARPQYIAGIAKVAAAVGAPDADPLKGLL